MAKNFDAATPGFTLIRLGEYAPVGGQILADGSPTNAKALNQFHNQLIASRSKCHVSRSWVSDASKAFGPALRSTAAAFEDVLEFRITPRQHVPYLTAWVNASVDGNGGDVRITTPAGSHTFSFAAAFSLANEQTNAVRTLPVTATSPPTTQLVTVALRKAGTSTLIDLRMLVIQDEAITLITDLP